MMRIPHNSKSCMICPLVPFPMTLSDSLPRFQGHGVIFRYVSALNVLCAQLTRDLFAIGKFLLLKGQLHVKVQCNDEIVLCFCVLLLSRLSCSLC